MAPRNSLPIIGSLNNYVLEELSFKAKSDSINGGEVKLTSSFEIGLKADTQDQYFVRLSIIAEGHSAKSKTVEYTAKCLMSGFWVVSETFKEIPDKKMIEIARMRAAIQLYPLVHSHISNMLATNGISMKSVPVEPSLDSFAEIEDKKIVRKEVLKKTTTKKSTSKKIVSKKEG